MQRSLEIAPAPAPGRAARGTVRLAILLAAAACRRPAPPPPPSPSPAAAPTPVPTAATPAAVIPQRLGLRPAEQRAVESFLVRHPELRPARRSYVFVRDDEPDAETPDQSRT
jgi:hypothetical protein